jgi:hypothetical protein
MVVKVRNNTVFGPLGSSPFIGELRCQAIPWGTLRISCHVSNISVIIFMYSMFDDEYVIYLFINSKGTRSVDSRENPKSSLYCEMSMATAKIKKPLPNPKIHFLSARQK